MTDKKKPVLKGEDDSPSAADCYAPAFDLLKRMEKASPVKCYCWIELKDGNISMRWSGTIRRGKHNEKEPFGMERILTRFDEPFIETILEDVSYALRALFKEDGA